MYGVGFDAGEGTGDDGNPRSSEGAGVGGLSFESSVALPPPDVVATWLAALVARDGATAVIKALLQSVAGDRIMDITEQICEQQFGREPVLADSLGEVRTRRLAVPHGASWRLVCSSSAHCALSHLLCVQRAWEATPRAGATSPESVYLLDRKRPRADRDGASLFKFRRCWHCEPYMGKSTEVCTAVQTFQGLAADVEEQAEKVREAEEFGDGQGQARRAARFFMYRLYVKTVFGFLGKGKRIRIPPCVVEHIRARFPEPACELGCRCKLGGQLFRCSLYTGHRDAPNADAGGE